MHIYHKKMLIKDPPVEFFVWLVFQMHGHQCSLQPLRHSPRRVDTGFFQILIVLAGKTTYIQYHRILQHGESSERGSECIKGKAASHHFSRHARVKSEVEKQFVPLSSPRNIEPELRVALKDQDSLIYKLRSIGSWVHRFMGRSLILLCLSLLQVKGFLASFQLGEPKLASKWRAILTTLRASPALETIGRGRLQQGPLLKPVAHPVWWPRSVSLDSERIQSSCYLVWSLPWRYGRGIKQKHPCNKVGMCLERIPQGTGLGKESVVAWPLPRRVQALLLPQVRPLRQRVGPWTNELTTVDSPENQMVNQAAVSSRSLGFSARSLATLSLSCHVSTVNWRLSHPVISSDSKSFGLSANKWLDCWTHRWHSYTSTWWLAQIQGVNVGDSKVVNFGLIFLSDEQRTLLGSLLEYIKYPTPTKISVETMRRGMPINGLAQLLDMQMTGHRVSRTKRQMDNTSKKVRKKNHITANGMLELNPKTFQTSRFQSSSPVVDPGNGHCHKPTGYTTATTDDANEDAHQPCSVWEALNLNPHFEVVDQLHVEGIRNQSHQTTSIMPNIKLGWLGQFQRASFFFDSSFDNIDIYWHTINMHKNVYKCI